MCCVLPLLNRSPSERAVIFFSDASGGCAAPVACKPAPSTVLFEGDSPTPLIFCTYLAEVRPRLSARGAAQERNKNHCAWSEGLTLHGHSADMRHNDTLSEEVSYASWTQNFSHDPPHACPTPDTPGVAACAHHLCGTSPTGPDGVTFGRRDDDHRHCRRRWPQPPVCLQVDTTLCAGRVGGAPRQT